MKYFLLLWLCISYLLSGQVQAFTQAELAEFAKNTELKFAVKTNFTSATAPKGQAELILSNKSSQPLSAGAGSWMLYFHAIRKQEAERATGINTAACTRRLTQPDPGKTFKGLKPGEQLRLTFSPSSSMVSYSDWMPRAFITAKGLNT